MSSNPFIFPGYLSDEPASSPSSASSPLGRSTTGRPVSYASVAATRSRTYWADYLVRRNNNLISNSTNSMRDDYDRAMMETHRNTHSGTQTSRSASAWQQLPKSPVLDRHSRLFEAFMSRDQLLSSEAPNPSPPVEGPTQISPSYLQGTEYMKKLNEQYKRRAQASKERHSYGGGLATSGSNQTLINGPMALPSHRGMTLDVVERLPATSSMQQDDKDEVKPLPTRWMKDDKSPPGLEITGDGFDVKCTGSKSLLEKDHEACAIRADHPMPGQCGVYYFEITVLSAKSNE